MKMTLDGLQKELEAYPERLRSALTRLDKARKRLDSLEERASPPLPPPQDSSVDLKLETEYEKCRLQYEKKRAQAEIKIRLHPPEGLKITESTVDALLKSDEKLSEMKERLLDLDLARKEQRLQARLAVPDVPQTDGPPEEDGKLFEAHEEVDDAENDLEVLRAQLETFHMLTAVLAGEKDGR